MYTVKTLFFSIAEVFPVMCRRKQKVKDRPGRKQWKLLSSVNVCIAEKQTAINK